jgi:hypothetical protein
MAVDRDNSVGIATLYGMYSQGFEYRCWWDFPHQSRQNVGPTQPPVQLVSGLLPGCKASRNVALTTYSPSTAEVKERVWLYLCSPFGDNGVCFKVNIYLHFFELRVSVHRGLMNKFQQDAANRVYISSLFCSTCFGRYIHPSSGASTESGSDTRTGDISDSHLPYSWSGSGTHFAQPHKRFIQLHHTLLYSWGSWWWVNVAPETCRAK